MVRKFQKSEKAATSQAEKIVPRLITAKELARHLATTERNINRQATEGAIPCITFGRSRRFDPLEVAKVLNLKNPIVLDEPRLEKS